MNFSARGLPALPKRRRTPSDLKWLLNERASLLGQTKQAARRLGALREQAAKLEGLLAAVRDQLMEVEHLRLALLKQVGALDVTVGLVHPGADPAAAGCVRAWAGRYGVRGALTDFIRAAVLSSGREGIRASALKERAIIEFELSPKTTVEHDALKHSIKSALVRLRDKEGVIEAGPEMLGRRPAPLWRWKQSGSLEALRALAAAAEAAYDAPPHPDAS